MKKTLILLSSVALLSAAFITGCKKDEDTTGPSISLNGSNPMEISLNDATSDPGATASDDEDGTVSVTSDWSSTKPNVNLKGTYTVTYTAMDAAGNSSTTTRTIHVVNDADFLGGSYIDAKDTCGAGNNSSFDATVTGSTTVNRKFTISNFGAFGAGVSVSCMLESNGDITVTPIPQSLGGSASLNSFFATESHVVSNNSPVKFVIKYGWTDGSMSDVCTSTYTK